MGEAERRDETPSRVTAWIAVDWGTSHLRVWLMAEDGAVIDRRTSDRGMATLSPNEFEPVLTELIQDVLDKPAPIPVICCGMVGARQGWAEAPYLEAPCPPPGIDQAKSVAPEDSRIAVTILPGVMQANPPDVMRGEETQIAGFLADEPSFHGTLCLPGTHTKWVRIENGAITGFRTFMTGELFALLTKQSVLRHCVSAEGLSEPAFDKAVYAAMEDPAALTGALFSIRAASLLSDQTNAAGRATLSGRLIGSELAASRSLWEAGEICIVGETGLSSAYSHALSLFDRSARTVSGDAMTLRGLTAAFHQMTKADTP